MIIIIIILLAIPHILSSFVERKTTIKETFEGYLLQYYYYFIIYY